MSQTAQSVKLVASELKLL